MLTGSRIITCHVTMEHTPPLPSGFNINGYLIQSLKQTDSLCHVYYASDADHVQYLLREFCPQGLAVRDPESGKLRYPENTDIEREVLPLKNDFEAQFRTGSLGEIPALGTLYLAYAIPGGHAADVGGDHHLFAVFFAHHVVGEENFLAAGSRHGRPCGIPPPARSADPGRSRNRRGGARSCGLPSPAAEKEELRRHMDSHPAPAGRRMRNLLFHPEPRGKTRLCSGAGRSPLQQGKEGSRQTGKESRPARRKWGSLPRTGKRRGPLPVRTGGAAGKNAAGHFLRGTE